MNYLPTVVKAIYLRDYLINLTFDDGSKKVVDFSQWLDGPIFEPLRDKRYFRKFFLDGATVSWPNGADIAPETLYEAESMEVGHNKTLLRTRKSRRRA